jgi:ComF family protein
VCKLRFTASIRSPHILSRLFARTSRDQLPSTSQQSFYGAFCRTCACCCRGGVLFFSSGSGTQRLLHQIKYNNRPDLITVIGHWYGKQLLNTPIWEGIDLIVPVPLHWKKQRKRGYNQSAVFGQAIGNVLGVPCHKNALVRLTHDKSLTGMNRLERVGTIGDSFAVAKKSHLNGLHILLVDDVLTTGATLEACALALIKSSVASIRMVTIACGQL